MTALNYTSGNPANLTAGGGAAMIDVQGPFNDIKSFLNGGTMDETNIPNLSAAFTHWRTIVWGGGVLAMGAGGTYLIPGGGAPQGSTAQTLGSIGTAIWIIDIDPTDWVANARTTKLRIKWSLTVNAVAPATTLTAGLYPVATTGGVSGGAPSIVTLGTVVTGSTAAFASPGATSHTVTASSEFNAPAVGPFVFGVVAAAGMAAGSQASLTGQIQMRQV